MKPLLYFFTLLTSAANLSMSDNNIVGWIQTGSVMKPLLYFFTLLTSVACSWIVKLLWMTPMAPSSAMPIAILCSVTVSIGLETIGVFNLIALVKLDSSTTSCTPKLICPGKQMRSSYVKPVLQLLSSNISAALWPSISGSAASHLRGERLRPLALAATGSACAGIGAEPARLGQALCWRGALAKHSPNRNG